MRLNKYVASATGMSRRAADGVIEQRRVTVNGTRPSAGQAVMPGDVIKFDDQVITAATRQQTIMLNKPSGYVVSRDGQGSKTVYDLLPDDLNHLKAIGRLDKYSSGLLLMTTDGQLANQLSHPRYQKDKIYLVSLNNPLSSEHEARLRVGVELADGGSRFTSIVRLDDKEFEVILQEGRNRQIRRTFDHLGYFVTNLHRTKFGKYNLGSLAPGKHRPIA